MQKFLMLNLVIHIVTGRLQNVKVKFVRHTHTHIHTQTLICDSNLTA